MAVAASAVAIGVAFVSGSLILAVGAGASYSRLARGPGAGVDVYVRGPEVDTGAGISDFSPVPPSLIPQVMRVRGVADVSGAVSRLGQLVSIGGRFLGDGRSTYAYSWSRDPSFSPFGISVGRPPVAEGEVVVDAISAKAYHLAVGDDVRVSLSNRSPLPARIVGLAIPEESGDLSGASAIFVSANWAQRVLDLADRWDLLEVRASRGTDPEVLRSRIAIILPVDGTSAVTSRQFADSQLANLSRRAGSVATFLVALSLLSLVVGAGIIRNTFAILSLQRLREFALLRVIGVSRRQLLTLVVGEASVIGVIAASLGATGGIPAVTILRSLAQRVQPGALAAPIHIDWWVPVATAAGGAVLTIGLAARPARRVAGLRPVELLRSSRIPIDPSHGHTIISSVIGAGGLVLLVVAHVWRAEWMWLAGGGLTVVGLIGSLPVAFGLLAGRLAVVATRIRAPGAVAVAAATVRRDPRRSVAPALALVVGLGAMTAVSVVASSAHASVATLVRRADRSDLVLVSDAAPGIDPEAVEKVRVAPGVRAVAETGSDIFLLDGRPAQLTALDTDFAGATFALPVLTGSLSNFADGDIAVTRSAAKGRSVGDLVGVRFAQPQRRALRIVAVIADNGITRSWIIPFETYRIGYQAATIRAVFVRAKAGVTSANLRRQVAVGVAGFPGIRVDDPITYASEQGRRAEGPIVLVQAIAGLAVVIAVFGIANALSLAVAERASELALLTTLGMTPSQISLMVQAESALIASVGAGWGVVCGLVGGISVVSAVGRRLTELAVPAAFVCQAVAAVILVAFVAAAIPARQAVGRGAAITE